jgi:hypothetical protein
MATQTERCHCQRDPIVDRLLQIFPNRNERAPAFLTSMPLESSHASCEGHWHIGLAGWAKATRLRNASSIQYKDMDTCLTGYCHVSYSTSLLLQFLQVGLTRENQANQPQHSICFATTYCCSEANGAPWLIREFPGNRAHRQRVNGCELADQGTWRCLMRQVGWFYS